MKLRLAILSLALIAPLQVATATGADPQPASAAGNGIFFNDVRVFDGESALGIRDVLVRDGRIVEVAERLQAPAGLAVVEGAGKTLLPGLIDAHTHSWGTAQADALRLGVTTELDMLGDWNRFPQLRQQRESLARTTQADLWSAGATVTAPGGHGTQYGMAVPTLAPGDDARAFVDARAKEGSDYIKILVEDFSAHSAQRRLPAITATQVAAAVDAAHANDRLAIVHVSLQRDGVIAAEAAADGLAHLFIDQDASDAFVRAAKRNDLFVIPTLSVLSGFAGAGEGGKLAVDARLQPMLSGEQVAGLKSSFPGKGKPELLPRALASVRKLHQAGIAMLAGTDAGNPGTAHGASMHGELELLTRAGLTPAQALAAATSVPAKRFKLGDRGRIAPGLRADLLLVEGDPTRDIAASRAIAGVWKNGYAVERALADGAKPVSSGAAAPTQTMLSDFEGAAVNATFGGGWSPTTDQMMGGTSTVQHQRVSGGANGSAGALEITGDVKAGKTPWAMWSGMMAMLGQQMQPVDFSARKELVFQARGDGRTYQVMLFSGPSMQGMPSVRTFVAGPQWQEVRLPLADFAGADTKLLRAIAFTAGSPAGTFAFRIDGVELR